MSSPSEDLKDVRELLAKIDPAAAATFERIMRPFDVALVMTATAILELKSSGIEAGIKPLQEAAQALRRSADALDEMARLSRVAVTKSWMGEKG